MMGLQMSKIIFPDGDKLEELEQLRMDAEDRFNQKYSSLGGRAKQAGSEGRAGEKANSQFKEQYIGEDMYVCSIYEKVYNQGILLSYKAELIPEYNIMEMCLNPDYSKKWIVYEEDIPDSTLVKDPYTQHSHPELYSRMKRSDKSHRQVVEDYISETCVLIELNWDPSDYVVHRLDEINNDQSIFTAMGDELSLHLVSGASFLDELI